MHVATPTIHLLILSAALSLFALPGQAEAAVEVTSADVGFGGVYQVGVWTSVRVVLKSSQDVQGTLRLVVPDGDGVPSTISDPEGRKIQLRADTPAETRLLARFGRVRGWFEVRFEADDGTETVRRFESTDNPSGGNTFRDALPTRQRLVLQLGQESIGLERALKGTIYEAEEGDMLVRLDSIDSLPDVWLGYEGVDTLIVVGGENAVAKALTADTDRVAAIRRWIDMGGKTVVFVGGEGDALLAEGSALASLIPGRYDSTVSLKQTDPFETFCDSEKPVPLSIRGNVSIPTPKLVDVRGKVEARMKEVPLVIRAATGFGTVTFAACDPSESPWAEWVDRGKFLRAVLDRSDREKSEVGELRAVMHYGYDDLAGQLRASLDQFEGVRFAPFSLIVFLLIAYVLLIGPVDYFFIRKIVKRGRVTWITFPAIVLLACLVGYWLSYWFKGNEVRSHQACVVDVDVESGLVRGTAWANVFSPSMACYNLEFTPLDATQDESRLGDRYTAWLGLPGSGIGGMDPRANPVFWKKGYEFTPSLTEMKEVPIAVWSSKSVTSRWLGSTEAMPEGSFHRTQDTLTGTFTNTASYPLKNCILAFERWVYRIGDIPPGKSVTVGTMTERSELKSLLNERKLVKDEDKDRYHHEATPYARGSRDPYYILRMMLFFEAGGGEDYTGLKNAYQGFLDMSRLLELDRAVLLAEVPAEHVGTVLQCNGRAMTGDRTQRLTLRRFVFPVKSRTRE